MTHKYRLTGMTCSGCEAKVKSSLFTLPDVTGIEVSKEENLVVVSMDKHVSLSDMQQVLGGIDSKYQISPLEHHEFSEQTKSWFNTYKPIIIIFGYITILSFLINYPIENREILMTWMRHFMAGFFLVFSFFKMLDLKGFTESYAMYDVVAKRIPVWGYIYASIEFLLGVGYVVNYKPLVTNIITLVIMSISIIGVLQSVLNKKKIQCACLGAVFNLPMSTVTIIEDGLMIIMSGIMLLYI